MNLEWISSVLGAPAVGSVSNRAVTEVTTDSRKVRPGSFFIAVKGDQFDGHDFISEVIEKGAAAIMVHHSVDVPGNWDGLVFRVSDTTIAFRSLAAAWRKRFKIPVIAIAGSVGKTTTKELIAAILSGKYSQIHKTLGSQNGILGIPMTLLGITSQHQAAVIEIGIDEPGTIYGHMDVVRPDFTIVTRIGPEHMEKMKTLENVAYEEGRAISETIKHGGSIALNLDDPWLAPWESKLPTEQRILYGMKSKRSKNALFGKQDGESLVITSSEGTGARLQSPLPGNHNLENLLGAVSVAKLVGLDFHEIERGLTQFKGAAGRSKVEKHASGATLLLDYYNANPSSMHAAFQTFDEIARKNICHNRVLVLGDMLELGTDELKYHRDLAEGVLATQPSAVLLFGPRMRSLKMELNRRGFSSVIHSMEKVAVSTELNSRLTADTAVLVKGSRGMKMEEVLSPPQTH